MKLYLQHSNKACCDQNRVWPVGQKDDLQVGVSSLTLMKHVLHRVSEVDFVKESKVLLDFIEKMKRGEDIMQAAPAGPQPGAYGASTAAPRVKTCCRKHSAL